jgi:hypothetical protein
MDLCQEASLYPEGCDEQGVDCMQCVRRTAEATRSLTASPTPEWASAVFQRMYTHAACRQMEHTFVWACGAGELVQIGMAVAAA